MFFARTSTAQFQDIPLTDVVNFQEHYKVNQILLKLKDLAQALPIEEQHCLITLHDQIEKAKAEHEISDKTQEDLNAFQNNCLTAISQYRDSEKTKRVVTRMLDNLMTGLSNLAGSRRFIEPITPSIIGQVSFFKTYSQSSLNEILTDLETQFENNSNKSP